MAARAKSTTKTKTKPKKPASSKPAFGSPEWQAKYGRGRKKAAK